MYKVILRNNNRILRKLRIRKTISGTAEQPRLTIFRSNKFIYGQLINDETGKTLLSVGQEVKEVHTGKTKVEAAFELGKLFGAKAKELKITKVVFDRNGYRYHGRVKSFADGVREGGLNL